MIQTDILVIGGGIAGLSYALKVSELHPGTSVTLISKDSLTESNTRYAQGGVAAVTDSISDSVEGHIADTLKAGDGLCDPNVVEFVVKEGPARIQELVELGAKFDRNGTGYDLAREGGHSANRVLHAADSTGKEILYTLISALKPRKNITVLEHHFAIDLICVNNTCHGALVINESNVVLSIAARITMIASGGIGQIYRHTTNPVVATGDGVAMAWRAGAKIRNMEFVQFHPTALWEKETKNGPLFLISEAVRGAGAHLLNHSGKRFMAKYDSRLELATRDTVSRAVQEEIALSGKGFVYLDCRHLEPERFQKHFPAISNQLLKRGIDVRRDLVPVVPAAHYSCGGICTGAHGETTVSRLFAAGETACTGLHGANRLASNSLPEALVFAGRAARLTTWILPHISKQAVNAITSHWENNTVELPDVDVRDQIREIMNSVAICCSQHDLNTALKLALDLRRHVRKTASPGNLNRQMGETRNMLDVAELVLKAALSRSENRGSFYKTTSLSQEI